MSTRRASSERPATDPEDFGATASAEVAVDRPSRALYRYWRDPSNLPRVLEHVRSVTVLDGRRSRWVIAAPLGQTLEFDAEIVEDAAGRSIAWRSLEGGDASIMGRVEFCDAPSRRGCLVRATIGFDPPGGALGRLIAELLLKEPERQVGRDLRRFKRLMEAQGTATDKPG